MPYIALAFVAFVALVGFIKCSEEKHCIEWREDPCFSPSCVGYDKAGNCVAWDGPHRTCASCVKRDDE